jgi:hypothetical protein
VDDIKVSVGSINTLEFISQNVSGAKQPMQIVSFAVLKGNIGSWTFNRDNCIVIGGYCVGNLHRYCIILPHLIALLISLYTLQIAIYRGQNGTPFATCNSSRRTKKHDLHCNLAFRKSITDINMVLGSSTLRRRVLVHSTARPSIHFSVLKRLPADFRLSDCR